MGCDCGASSSRLHFFEEPGRLVTGIVLVAYCADCMPYHLVFLVQRALTQFVYLRLATHIGWSAAPATQHQAVVGWIALVGRAGQPRLWGLHVHQGLGPGPASICAARILVARTRPHDCSMHTLAAPA